MSGMITRRAVAADPDYLATPAQLYAALAEPGLPLPSFIEGWALNSFHGVAYMSPNVAGSPVDAMGNTLVEFQVSGVAGAATLTILGGDQTKGTGTWGAIVQHDDGTYGAYTVSAMAGGTCTVFPNVRKTITNQTLGNLGGSALGQHLSERGYKALARKVFGTTRDSAYRLRRAAQWSAATGNKADWDYVGGAANNQDSIGNRNNFLQGSRANGSFISRARMTLAQSAPAPFTGKGRSKTFALGGSTGYMELFACCADLFVGFYAFHVKVVVDAVTLLDVTYGENDGLQRIVVPYTNGTSATVTITMADEAGAFPNKNLFIDSITWWAYDRVPVGYAWTDPVIDKSENLVVLGDSWTTFYPSVAGGIDGALVRELQTAITAAGGVGTVTGVGTAGTTAEYGLSKFDAVVAPKNPKAVLICYFTNDQNQYGYYGSSRWLSAMFKLGRKCQLIGARPVFLMPLPTQSQGQGIGHGIWADAFGAGLAR